MNCSNKLPLKCELHELHQACKFFASITMNAAFDKLAPRFVGSVSVWLRYVLPNRKARKGETAKTAMSAVYCFDEKGDFLGHATLFFYLYFYIQKLQH